MNTEKLSCGKRRQGIWGRAISVKPTDTLKLPNRFPGEKPFKPTYDGQPEMGKLLNFGYYRLWKNEHDAFMIKRVARANPPKRNFPIYRNIVKLAEPQEKPIVPNKKYANVKSKVFDIFLMYQNKSK